MSDFDKFWDALKAGLVELAKTLGQQYLAAALQDGQNFLRAQQAELQRWTAELAAGQLSKEEFEDLVMGQKDLAEMVVLKQEGLAQVQVDRFVTGVLNLVITTAIKVFL
jgi:predicted transcriptional regulator